jgi:hypothetical protein
VANAGTAGKAAEKAASTAAPGTGLADTTSR